MVSICERTASNYLNYDSIEVLFGSLDEGLVEGK